MNRTTMSNIFRHSRWLTPASVAVVAFTAAGCGGNTGRQEVSGVVKIDGQPLAKGEISLRPLEKGPAAAGRIENGRFELNERKGPLPGPYAVTIESYQETGKMIALVDSPGTKVNEILQTIPSRYNDRTELRVEVQNGGDNFFEFELQTN